MPIGLGLASIIGSGLSMVGSLAGSIFGSRARASQSRRNVQRTIAAQKAMALKEFQRNKKMWHMMNAYNTPLMQMQRFEEAGLNPNLIYGQGTPGNVGSYPTYNAPQLSYRGQKAFDPYSGIGDAVGDAVGKYFGIRSMQAQTSLTQQREATEVQETIKKSQEALKASYEKALTKWEMQRMESIMQRFDQNFAIYGKKGFQAMVAEFDKATLSKLYQQLKNDYQKEVNKWSEEGMSLGDNVLYRGIYSIISKLGNFLGLPTGWLDLNK